MAKNNGVGLGWDFNGGYHSLPSIITKEASQNSTCVCLVGFVEVKHVRGFNLSYVRGSQGLRAPMFANAQPLAIC